MRDRERARRADPIPMTIAIVVTLIVGASLADLLSVRESILCAVGRWLNDLAEQRTRQILESAERRAVWAEEKGDDEDDTAGTEIGRTCEQCGLQLELSRRPCRCGGSTLSVVREMDGVVVTKLESCDPCNTRRSRLQRANTTQASGFRGHTGLFETKRGYSAPALQESIWKGTP